MCIKYDTFFTNAYINVETQIVFGGNNSKYVSPMVINGLIVETDGFEGLYIETFEDYTKEQLKIVDYDIKNGLYILRNYKLETIIPIIL
jgi:hypothetical protein